MNDSFEEIDKAVDEVRISMAQMVNGIDEFIGRVYDMRELQKKFFRCRQQSVLLKAKEKEAEVDKSIKTWRESKERTLFDDEPQPDSDGYV